MSLALAINLAACAVGKGGGEVDMNTWTARLTADTSITTTSVALLTKSFTSVNGNALNISFSASGLQRTNGNSRFRVLLDGNYVAGGIAGPTSGDQATVGVTTLVTGAPAALGAHTVSVQADTDGGTFEIFPSGAAEPGGATSPVYGVSPGTPNGGNSYPMQANLVIEEVQLGA